LRAAHLELQRHCSIQRRDEEIKADTFRHGHVWTSLDVEMRH